MPRTDARRRGAAARAVWTLVLVGLLACVGLGAAGERPYGDRSRAADVAVDRAAPAARTHAGARTRVADRAAAVDAPVIASPG
ncbi:hypothetical protein, partial [Streptomyces roseolilacinus]|uniref:hypothetical protein n=1 Tax=Streptomyces roseolilacinus TaxID=66904 RepID=UPI003819AD3C